MASHADLAEKYLVDDLPGASRTGARLNGILLRIEAGEILTALARLYLDGSGLRALLAFATDETDRETFREIAARERSERIWAAERKAEEAEETAAATAAERTRQDEAMDAATAARFAAMENDPDFRRKREARELRCRFDIGFVEREVYARVMRLLKQVAAGTRLRPEDVAWLKSEASECWTDALQRAWHRLEAAALTEEWERSGDV